MTKMNPEVKAKWLAALRSGEYSQTADKLRDTGSGGYCCLGVLCDLYAKERMGGKWIVSHLAANDGEDEEPSYAVAQWAGLEKANPEITLPNEWRTQISVMNDGGIAYSGGNGRIEPHTFAQIADVIESQL
jgi:hypothetical protein